MQKPWSSCANARVTSYEVASPRLQAEVNIAAVPTAATQTTLAQRYPFTPTTYWYTYTGQRLPFYRSILLHLLLTGICTMCGGGTNLPNPKAPPTAHEYSIAQAPPFMAGSCSRPSLSQPCNSARLEWTSPSPCAPDPIAEPNQRQHPGQAARTLPTIIFAALRFDEIGMDIAKSLRTLILSLNPTCANTLVRLRERPCTLSQSREPTISGRS